MKVTYSAAEGELVSETAEPETIEPVLIRCARWVCSPSGKEYDPGDVVDAATWGAHLDHLLATGQVVPADYAEPEPPALDELLVIVTDQRGVCVPGTLSLLAVGTVVDAASWGDALDHLVDCGFVALHDPNAPEPTPDPEPELDDE